VYLCFFVYKCLIILSVFALIRAATKEQILQLGSMCNGTEADLKVTLDYSVPSTDTGKCLVFCMIKILNMLSPQGGYNRKSTLDALKAYWKEWSNEDTTTVADFCETQLSTVPAEEYNTCEIGYKILKCINSKSKEMGLLKSV